MRSLLLVHPDRAAALDEALRTGADALILALSEAPGAASTPAVRDRIRGFLDSMSEDENRPLLYVHLPAIEAETIDLDLAAVMAAAPDGILLGHCRSSEDAQHLGAKLAVHEATAGLEDGTTSIIAEAGSSAVALFAMESYRRAGPRLVALSWDSEALAADLGLSAQDGLGSAPLAHGRMLTLIAARAAGIAAIDTASAIDDEPAFRAACEAARRDGFNAKIATTHEQVAMVNAVFDRDL